MSKEKVHGYIPDLTGQYRDGRVSRREFIRTATLLGLSAASAYGLAGTIDGIASPAHAQEAKPKGGVLRLETTVYDVKSPAVANTTAHPWIYSQVVEYLTVIGSDNVTRPHLLESWEPSDDLSVWTLRVRDGVTWHSGRAFTADDVIWNLTRLLSDEVGSSMLGLMKGYMLNDVDSGKTDENGKKIITHELWAPNAIEKVDDMTVRLNLKAPQLAVPEHLNHYQAVMLDPAEGGTFDVGSNGTGAFTLTEIEPGRGAVIEAVESYWGEGPYLDKVEFVDLGGGDQAIINALISGQVHGAFQVQPELARILEAQDHLTLYDVTTADTAVSRMRVTEKPFDDPRVRKAFRLAIDPAKACAVAFGPFATPAEHHHVAPIHPEYAKLPEWKQDVEGAKALLAEAGYGDGLEVELTIQQNPPHHLRSATAMQEMLKDAGVTCNINVVPNAQYWDMWTTVPFGTTVWAHRPLGVINLGLAYRSGGAWNESGYSNPEFDRLLTEAEAMPDPEVRRGKMAEIEALMQEDGPIVQTYWRKLLTFYDKKVVGFEMHPTYALFANKLAIRA
ncbi:MAG: ABC transporter substrate-binding protein [Rhodobacteraceae bacterium]|nr:ABC transporter substrate-binding protein [Paracoccaceae bacterium]